MAGHSKWANIKHRKARQDAKRGKQFTKLIRAITIAARQGGGELSHNSNLRLAIDKALAANMPRDTIDRAIKRGAGGQDGADLEQIIYEGYGVGGVAVLVECMTDNRNRTVAEVRHAFTKCGGNLGTAGSVSYLFTKRGEMHFAPGNDEEQILSIALEHEAEDVQTDEAGSINVVTTPENFEVVKNALQQAGFIPEQADIVLAAETQIALDKDNAEKMMRLADILEDLDDTQNVYSNADIPEDILNELE